jgi:hypothetical protein
MSMTRTSTAVVLASAVSVALPLAAARPAAGEDTKHAPGIYVVTRGTDGAEEQVRLVGARPHEVKNTGLAKMMLSQGLLKGSTLVELAGTTADLHVSTSSPTFYFYFDAGSAQQGMDPMAALGQMMGGDGMPMGAKTAADFSLVHLTLSHDNRQANMGKTGSTQPKDVIECTEERLAQGVYKLQPKGELKPGEYAFFFTNSMPGAGMMQAWDFSVDATQR